MISYYLAAQRADRAMYQVEAEVECPSCGELVGCVVYGDDVSITDACVNGCHRKSHFDRDALDAAALAVAAGERTDYISHLREYDDD